MVDKNLKIGHLNVSGLVNKLLEVQLLLEVVSFDILGITETHLNESVTDIGSGFPASTW